MSKTIDETANELSEKWGVIGGKFIISTGQLCELFRPKPEDIDINVIAHSISKMCRFNGHVSRFYSVAQHSVLVSRNCPEFALHGLLHDASEAFLGDVIRPIKHIKGMSVYMDAEKVWQKAIFERFGLSPEMPDEVKLADNRLLLTEFRDLFSEIPEKLRDTGVEPYEGKIYPINPEPAKIMFLMRWKELTKGLI